jgi:pimeloyl-ACP methyl ester carboxylesterase
VCPPARLPACLTTQVVALDQRFHGDSDSPPHGFHVSRLAADLQELLQHLDLSDVTAVGTSMGCAVIWSYLELFGPGRISKVRHRLLPCVCLGAAEAETAAAAAAAAAVVGVGLEHGRVRWVAQKHRSIAQPVLHAATRRETACTLVF